MAMLDQKKPVLSQSSPLTDLPNRDQGLLTNKMCQKFAHKIKSCFPTCVATVLADAHGFPVYSNIENELDENLLALSAIEERRHFLDLSSYHKIVKPLGKDLKMLILLKKARENYVSYGNFVRTINKDKLVP